MKLSRRNWIKTGLVFIPAYRASAQLLPGRSFAFRQQPAAAGGIAFDAATVGTYDTSLPATISHTASGSNRYAIVLIHIDGTDAASSVTYGVGAMTSLGVQNPPGSYGRTEIWGIIAPATGAQTIAIVGSAENQALEVISFTGVHQTTPTGTAVTANGESTAVSVTATSASGELVVDGVTISLNTTETATVGASQTERGNNLQSGTIRWCCSTEPGVASTAMTWTISSIREWSQVAVPLKPA